MGSARTGVVLVNLGTPTAPEPKAVKTFLREFLSDRRVVGLPAPFWRTLLELCVLPVRSPKSAAKYASIWYPEGSPLAVHTAQQVAGLAARLGSRVEVVSGYRYGKDSTESQLARLHRAGVERVLVVPMYPQYSTTTVASVVDQLARHALDVGGRSAAERTRLEALLSGAHPEPGEIPAGPGCPELRWLSSFETYPGYIAAAASRVEDFWAEHGHPDFAAGERLLLSFHGIPEQVERAGDPYRSQCLASAELLRARLAVPEDGVRVTFQSKFGPSCWLTPATIDTVRELGASGTPRVDVFCPGFAVDCLETLEEIGLLNRDAYLAARPGAPEPTFNRIPCLNDHPAWMDALAALVSDNLADWPTDQPAERPRR